MKAYTVLYKEHEAAEPKMVVVLAKNKADAWEKAVFDVVGGGFVQYCRPSGRSADSRGHSSGYPGGV